MNLRINLWSGPRSTSTALMYSFRQRADTRVIDEPLYGHFLKVTKRAHPGVETYCDQLEADWRRTVDRLLYSPCDRAVLFCKQMAHQLVGDLDLAFLDSMVNVFLIRHPAQVIGSLARQLPDATVSDIGIARQSELFDYLRARGQEPPVIASCELLQDPEHVLRELCCRINLEWDPTMLSWLAGPKPEDGPWASWWYHNVHLSTGFSLSRS